MEEHETPFDTNDQDILSEVTDDESEGSLGTREKIALVVRTLTVVLTLIGGILLVIKIKKRRRGSWVEALIVITFQLVWQVLAWYIIHIDSHWVFHFDKGNVDSETSKKVYHCIQNLFAGLAMYSGVVVVGRLAGLVGLLLYVLTGMAILAPIVFSVTILLLDLQLSSSLRFQQPTKIGIASFRSCILDLVPLGLLICWTFSQCRVTRREKSSREMSSNLIAAASILLHLVGLAQYVVYVMLNTATDLDFKLLLVDWDLGLSEATFLLASIALPWMWLLGLSIPLPGQASDQLDLNLKLAKQNKSRNIIKYQKEKSPVATPPTSPYKFSPEVTSSPSVHSTTSMEPTPLSLAPAKKEKRRSYLEAVSDNSLHVLENAPPRQSKSADPLWLPSGKPVQL